MSGADKPARELIGDDWSSLVTRAAMQIQTMEKPLNRFVTALNAFADSPMGRDILDGVKEIIAAEFRAQIISDAIHGAHEIQEIQKTIDSMPLNAVTLLSLITIERSREASQVEQQAAERNRETHKKRSSEGGHARIANDKDGKQAAKLEAYGFFVMHEYAGPTAFAKAMLDKFPVLESQPVIERWYRDWKKGINLPKNIEPNLVECVPSRVET